VLALAGVVVLLVNRESVYGMLYEILPVQNLPIGEVLALVLAWLASMSCLTGCSISLEGRTMWQLKSLPVRGLDVFHAKLGLNLMTVLPVTLLAGAGAAFALRLSAPGWLWLELVPALYTFLIVQTGLLVNVKWHRFDWTNETTIVKQSAGTMIPVLLSMFTTFPLIYFVAVAENPAAFMAVLSAVLLAVSAGIYALIRKNAERWYAAL